MGLLTIQNIEEGLRAILRNGGEDAVPEMVNTLVNSVLAIGATDLHLECFRNEIICKVRLDGMLHAVARLDKEFQDNIIARLKIMARVASFKTRQPQDGRIELTSHDKQPILLRASFLPTLFGEKVVIRIPDPSHAQFDIEMLGMDENTRQRIMHMIRTLQGTLLLTGPSSSGKTTTIYALLKYLHRHFSERINIMTIEEPIETALDSINQTQLDVAGGLDYSDALKAMLRQDPNVLVVGEIRDDETAHICIEAGLTGHLVISTIHSGDAVGVVNRLLNMGIEPFLVASSLSGVIAQRLVRKVCTACAQPRDCAPSEKAFLGISPDTPMTIMEGSGCQLCKNSGFKGRTGLFELLHFNDAVRDLILHKPSTETLRRCAVEMGMKTIQLDAIAKIQQGITTPSEVMHLFCTH